MTDNQEKEEQEQEEQTQIRELPYVLLEEIYSW